VDALAKGALNERRYEDAYRLVTRGLCMDESTESEKTVRDQMLRALVVSYAKLAFVGWLGAAVVWLLVVGAFSHFHVAWWFVLGLIPLPFAVQWFAQDVAVHFSGPKERVMPAILIGVICFLSGAGIGAGTLWTDWIGLASVGTATCVFGLLRLRVRAMRTKLEAHIATFSSPQAMERYVLDFDPKPERLGRTILTLLILVALLAVQPILYLALGVHRWALDRTTVQFDVLVDGKPAQAFGGAGPPPEVLFNGTAIRVGDKVAPGKGVVEVTDVRFMPFRREVRALYGRVANVGDIALIPAHGQLNITCDPPDAEYQLMNQSHGRKGNFPIQMDLPTGDYQLIARRKGWELETEMSVVREVTIIKQIEFPYGSVEVTSDPASMRISTNGVEIGKTPITLSELKPGQYRLTATDGEDERTDDVSVGSRETLKHVFTFRYGAVYLTSAPAGATVLFKGAEVGKTPLNLKHLMIGESTLELRFDG
jgi:hypothetical protein